MTLEEALKIIDPVTQEEALSAYPGYCGVINARVAEASRIVVDICRAAVSDLEYVARTSQNYDCSCALCTGGLGGGKCAWPDGVDMPLDACEKCGKCGCANCDDRSEWEWNLFWRCKT